MDMPMQQSTNENQSRKQGNFIKNLHLIFTHTPLQNFTEKSNLGLTIMHFLLFKKMTTQKKYDKVKELILYTCKDINYSISELDRRVDPGDKPDYHRDKNTKIPVKYNETSESKSLDLNQIQKILVDTIEEITFIVNEELDKNLLIDYWS